MEVIHERCAGMDVSKRDAKVCVRVAGRGRRKTVETVSTWASTTHAILRLREHLIAERVSLVVMEATGELLEAVLLPPRGRRVRGDAGQRPAGQEPAPAQDRRLRRDLAGPARRPRAGPGIVRATGADPSLRDLTRARTMMTRERGREIQRLEKLLEDAGIKLSSVASDITGVSGRLMLQALIDGPRDPAVLADLAKRRLRVKIPELTEALTGRFSEHHAFLARVSSTSSRHLDRDLVDGPHRRPLRRPRR